MSGSPSLEEDTGMAVPGKPSAVFVPVGAVDGWGAIMLPVIDPLRPEEPTVQRSKNTISEYTYLQLIEVPLARVSRHLWQCMLGPRSESVSDLSGIKRHYSCCYFTTEVSSRGVSPITQFPQCGKAESSDASAYVTIRCSHGDRDQGRSPAS